MTGSLASIGVGRLVGLLPMVERALSIEPAADIRIRVFDGRLSAFVRLPFDVLAGCTLDAGDTAGAGRTDVTVAAADLLRWCTQPELAATDRRSGVTAERAEPPRRDSHWLTAVPPRNGWQRIDVVPADVVQRLVRSGAELVPSVASRTAQQSLLASTVLTASNTELSVDVPLGLVSGLVRMGFLPPDGAAAIDAHPGWLRVAAAFGSTYQSRRGEGLDVLGGLLG